MHKAVLRAAELSYANLDAASPCLVQNLLQDADMSMIRFCLQEFVLLRAQDWCAVISVNQCDALHLSQTANGLELCMTREAVKLAVVSKCV